jgi:hypothetical protein
MESDIDALRAKNAELIDKLRGAVMKMKEGAAVRERLEREMGAAIIERLK